MNPVSASSKIEHSPVDPPSEAAVLAQPAGASLPIRPVPIQAPTISLKDRFLRKLDSVESFIEQKLPCLWFQRKLDELGAKIESLFQAEPIPKQAEELVFPFAEHTIFDPEKTAPMSNSGPVFSESNLSCSSSAKSQFFNLFRYKFHAHLHENGHGAWYRQLAIFLIKLPFRAIDNVLELIYRIIKYALYTTIHPVKASVKLAKLLIHLIDALLLPETWAKIGSGLIGASLGQSLILGTPIHVIGIALGAAMTLGGISVGTLKAAIYAEKGKKIHAIKEHLLLQSSQIAESLLTGFIIGLLVGTAQKVQSLVYRPTTPAQAEGFADQFIKDHNLPQYSSATLENGKVIIQWSGEEFELVKQINPDLFRQNIGLGYIEFDKGMSIVIPPSHLPVVKIDTHSFDWEGQSVSRLLSYGQSGFSGPAIALAPDRVLNIVKNGAIAATSVQPK